MRLVANDIRSPDSTPSPMMSQAPVTDCGKFCVTFTSGGARMRVGEVPNGVEDFAGEQASRLS